MESTSSILWATSTNLISEISNLHIEVSQLEKKIIEFNVSQTYFSDILNSQIAIFSLIVGTLVAVYFIFSWKVNNEKLNKIKDNLSDELSKKNEEEREKDNSARTLEIEAFKKSINSEFEEKNKKLESKLDSLSTSNHHEITILSGEIYRTLGEYWSSQKSFSTSFIWWIRAAEKYCSAGDAAMTRIALGRTKEAVSKVDYGTSLSPEIIGEYQKLIELINNVDYKIEKELLEKELKETLNRKI